MDMDFKPQNNPNNTMNTPDPQPVPAEPAGAPPVSQAPDGAGRPVVPPSDRPTVGGPVDAPNDDSAGTEQAPLPDGVTDTAAKPFPAEQHALPAHVASNKPIGAIITAIVIALILAALTVFAFIKTSNTIEPITNGSDTNNQSSATPADVDETIKNIDESLNSVDDTQDVNNEGLSDPSLGL
jgi:hypothetical protein